MQQEAHQAPLPSAGLRRRQRARGRVGASADADEQVSAEKQLGKGQRDGHEGRQIEGEREAGERVPSPLLFIAAIDRGVCALIQVDHLLELDKRARAWALCCHSWSVQLRERERMSEIEGD